MTNDPLIGRQLANFRIVRVIGRGGMGQIYFGEDVKLGRPVAIKVIDTRYRGNPAYAERFVREARAVAAWRHDNIIQIHYADDQAGLYYFVMEYIDGSDLGQLLARHVREGRQMTHAEVLRIGRAIAGALDYAHAKGVIHRDVKPSNVMVANDGRIVLTDFGLAMDVQQGSMGEVFGSSHYIAPEQARRSSDAVPQSDLYALGVMLYEMLTGIVPFDDPSPTTVALQHLTQAPPPPRQVNPSLSQAIEQVLLTALAKTPGERYPTGAALIAALEQAMQGKAKGGAKSPRRPRSLLGQESLVGHQLDEYQIETLLGRGGMAHIYRALDVPLNRYVAIKVIDPPLRADPDYAQRFKREAQAIAQLDHPNIVSIHRSGDAEGLLYIVMQYIEGSNLDFVLDSFSRDGEFIPPDQILRLTREVCAALDYAHGKGVIHRDVKPSNIMVEPNGRAILTDFGLALLKTVGTQGKIFGSPHYISPEQAVSSARVVPQSDLYAVGVMLYQMLTGQLPFDADEALEVAMLHLTEEPRPPRSLRPELSPALETMVLKCLAKEPTDRYPSGAALVAALELAIKNSRPGLAAASSRSIPQRVAAQLASQSPIPPPAAGRAQAVAAPAPTAANLPAASRSPAAKQQPPAAAPPLVAAPASPAGKQQAKGRRNEAPVQAAIGPTIVQQPARPAAPAAKTPAAKRPTRARRAFGCLLSLLVLLVALAGLGYAAGIVTEADAERLMASLGLGAASQSATPSPPPAGTPGTPNPPTGTPGAYPAATASPAATDAPAGPTTPPPTAVSAGGSSPISPTLAAEPTGSPAEPPAVAPLTPTLPLTATGGTAATTRLALPLLASTFAFDGTEPPNSLSFFKRDIDTLYILNNSPRPVSIARLRLDNAKGGITGANLAIATLAPGMCEILAEAQSYPIPEQSPSCGQRHVTIIRTQDDHFWTDSFEIYIGDRLIGSCPKEEQGCTVIFAP